jgi:hypothetical protein
MAFRRRILYHPHDRRVQLAVVLALVLEPANQRRRLLRFDHRE